MKLLLKNRLKSERIRKGAATNLAGIISCGIFSWDSVFHKVNDLCAAAHAFVAALVFAIARVYVRSRAFVRRRVWICRRACLCRRAFVCGRALFATAHAFAVAHAFAAAHAWGVTPFEYFICADAIDYETCVRACVASVLAVSEAVAAYVLLFVRADRDQAEDAEQISSSWWGYRILIPVYVVCLMCFIPPDFRWDNIFLMAIVLVGAFIGFFAYRRSFRLQRSDFISIGVTYAVGILLMLIGG